MEKNSLRKVGRTHTRMDTQVILYYSIGQTIKRQYETDGKREKQTGKTHNVAHWKKIICWTALECIFETSSYTVC